MLKVTIEITSSNYDGSQGEMDQTAALHVTSKEEYRWTCRGDESGMPEIKLAKTIRDYLEGRKL